MIAHPDENPHQLASAAVVVGTDGSSTSDAAVRWAAQTAARKRRRLLIVHGLDLAGTRAVLGSYDAMEPSVTAPMHAHGEHILTKARELAHDFNPELAVITELFEANPAKLLIELSQSADLVALGATPGVGTVAHLGSTLLTVVSHGHGATVVVRGTDAGQPAHRGGPVVVGVDGSPVGEAAIAAAFAEASERDAELVTVHAWSDLSVGAFAGSAYLEIPVVDLEIAEHALLAERLAGWQEKYPDVTVTRKVSVFGPRELLVKWSESAQLIVVGSRGRGGFRSLLLGSTSNWLVQHADCPVMVVHSK
ncbi:universal stress protein [Nocardia australiensis]|uniref:universal stress protein n=1 Tax=Nocardia australiensis TaxID=2887191 RepID=UPI001D155E17|nr:universal stress protein [Nocardia australiensis]